MSLVSSNRQPTCDVYVTVSREKVHRTSCHAGNTINVDLDANGVPVGVEVLGALEYAIDGPRVTPQASSAEHSDEDLIEAVSRKLQQEFRLRIGPNTRRHVTGGQEFIPLSLRECHDVALAAVTALKKVTS